MVASAKNTIQAKEPMLVAKEISPPSLLPWHEAGIGLFMLAI